MIGIEYHQSGYQSKAYFYFWMTAAEDVESQQKGVVFLVWPGPTEGARSIPNQIDRALHMKCNEASPIRLAAVHFCYPNTPFFQLLRSIMTMTLNMTYRLRLKFHVGESQVQENVSGNNSCQCTASFVLTCMCLLFLVSFISDHRRGRGTTIHIERIRHTSRPDTDNG